MPAIARTALPGNRIGMRRVSLGAVAILHFLGAATPGAAMPLPDLSPHDVLSWSILADSSMDTSSAETLLVRYHSTPEGVVQIAYNESAQLLLEASLADVVDYAQFDRQGEAFAFHFLLLPDRHEAYTLGPGRNDLQTWDQAFFSQFNYIEHSGYGLASALERDWPDDLYLVAVRPEDSGEEDSKDRRWKYSVKNRDTGELELEVRLQSLDENGVPAEKLEYLRDGMLAKVVENSDFRDVAPGLPFPFQQEVRHLFPEVRHEQHTIRDVQINLPFDARLFESPPRYPGARVFHHHLVNGDDIPVEELGAAFTLPLDNSLTLEAKRHAPVLATPVTVLTASQEQAALPVTAPPPMVPQAPGESPGIPYPFYIAVLVLVLSGIRLYETRVRKP